jgi:hypothetical protein
MRIWKNPEFVRHFRAELRTMRALTVGAVVLLVAALIWLGCWSSRSSEIVAMHRASAEFGNPSAESLAKMEQQSPIVVWFNVYRSLIFAQLCI